MKLGEIFNLVMEIVKSPFKGKSLLYHSTTYDRAINVIKDNQIYGASKQTIRTKLSPDNPFYNEQSKTFSGVSLTRDWRLDFSDVQFILDRDLIARDYGKKLVPFDFFNPADKRKGDPERNDVHEAEEFLIGDLNNVSKYLLGIRIMEVYSTLQGFIEDDYEGYLIFKKVVGKIPVYDKNFKEIRL